MNEKKMGRPEVKEPRSEKIICTCSLSDKKKLIELAAQKNMTLSNFILNCVKQFI